MICENLGINEKGHLTFAGFDTVELAEKYGTPLYLLDEDRVRKMCRIYTGAIKKYFGGDSHPLYASKALSFAGIYKIALEENMGIDVVSAGEIHTAKAAGYPLEKAYFHGNAKSDFEIEYAMESGVGCFVTDNADELDRVDDFAKKHGIKQKILLRLTPGIDPHTFAAVNTGKVDSKFGTAIETGQAEEIVKYALTKENIDLAGFHCHIGSQVFDCKPFTDGADVMLAFIADMKSKLGYEARELNLGGGFGTRYVEEHPTIDIDANIKEISEHVKAKCAEYELVMPAMLFEPGRSIVADAGMTLYTVESIKKITGYKNYAAIDGGMTDDPRYALYGSQYTVYLANKANAARDFKCTVAGRCCESGDLIQEDVMLPELKRGDVVAVLTTGAYNYSMASNYNRVPRPPIVILSGGKDRIGVKRESLDDLTMLDVL